MPRHKWRVSGEGGVVSVGVEERAAAEDAVDDADGRVGGVTLGDTLADSSATNK
jgi:hypothetical protein